MGAALRTLCSLSADAIPIWFPLHHWRQVPLPGARVSLPDCLVHFPVPCFVSTASLQYVVFPSSPSKFSQILLFLLFTKPVFQVFHLQAPDRPHFAAGLCSTIHQEPATRSHCLLCGKKGYVHKLCQTECRSVSGSAVAKLAEVPCHPPIS